LRALGLELPAEARSVFVMDWGKFLGSLVATAKALAPMLGESVSFDFSKLPPPEMFSEYFKPTFHYSKGIDGGVYQRNEASFGPETWLPPILLGAARAAPAMMAAREAQERAKAVELERATRPTEPSGGGR
jgi:hypothetical protein